MNNPTTLYWYNEIKLFIKFFIEAYLILIIIQLISKNINNNTINYLKDAKTALLVAVIVYIAKCINQDLCDNVRQGMAYAVSTVFISLYPI
jgi:hypothetical protein